MLLIAKETHWIWRLITYSVTISIVGFAMFSYVFWGVELAKEVIQYLLITWVFVIIMDFLLIGSITFLIFFLIVRSVQSPSENTRHFLPDAEFS
jgi:hypothetical protein